MRADHDVGLDPEPGPEAGKPQRMDFTFSGGERIRLQDDWDLEVLVRTNLRSQDGYWLPLEEPGLGVEVDETEARKYPFQLELFEQSVYHEDGSVAEW